MGAYNIYIYEEKGWNEPMRWVMSIYFLDQKNTCEYEYINYRWINI